MKRVSRLSYRLIFAMLLCSTSIPGCSGGKDTPDVTFERGRMLGDRGQFEDAIPLYNLALESLPDRAVIYYERGRAYEGLGLLEKAIEDYTTCLHKEPGFLQALNNKGVVLAKLERFQEAAHEFGLLIAEQPEDVLALRNRGLCFHDQAEFDQALADYDKALGIAPNDTETWFQRGNVFLEQEKFTEAITNYDKAIEHDVKYAKAWMNRGVARYGLNQREAALKDLEQAQLLDDSIVLPGIDWLSTGDATTAAKPVYPEAASNANWTEVLNVAMTALSEKGVQNVRLNSASAIPEQLCGSLTGTAGDRSVVAYFGVQADGASNITLPAITDTDDRFRVLVIIKGSDAGEFRVDSFVENWDPSTEEIAPTTISVKVK